MISLSLIPKQGFAEPKTDSQKHKNTFIQLRDVVAKLVVPFWPNGTFCRFQLMFRSPFVFRAFGNVSVLHSWGGNLYLIITSVFDRAPKVITTGILTCLQAHTKSDKWLFDSPSWCHLVDHVASSLFLCLTNFAAFDDQHSELEIRRRSRKMLDVL